MSLPSYLSTVGGPEGEVVSRAALSKRLMLAGRPDRSTAICAVPDCSRQDAISTEIRGWGRDPQLSRSGVKSSPQPPPLRRWPWTSDSNSHAYGSRSPFGN